MVWETLAKDLRLLAQYLEGPGDLRMASERAAQLLDIYPLHSLCTSTPQTLRKRRARIELIPAWPPIAGLKENCQITLDVLDRLASLRRYRSGYRPRRPPIDIGSPAELNTESRKLWEAEESARRRKWDEEHGPAPILVPEASDLARALQKSADVFCRHSWGSPEATEQIPNRGLRQSEFANMTGVWKGTITRAVQSGDIKSTVFNGKTFLDVSSAWTWLKKHREKESRRDLKKLTNNNRKPILAQRELHSRGHGD